MGYVSLLPAEHRFDFERTHRQVMAIFPRDLPGPARERRLTSNILWREESAGILVRSDIAPSHLPREGRTAPEPEFALTGGEPVSLVLTVDAAVHGGVTRSDGASRATTRVRETSEVLADLRRRLSPGLQHIAFESAVTTAWRGRHRAINLVRVSGVATVDEPQSLEALLRRGVGRSKAYGAGLLTVAPVAGA